MNAPWLPICSSGHYTLTVLTVAAAMAEGFGVHPSAVLVGLCAPDDRDDVAAINFATVEGLRTFMQTCEPREVFYRGAPGEDVDLISLVLAAHTLH